MVSAAANRQQHNDCSCRGNHNCDPNIHGATHLITGLGRRSLAANRKCNGAEILEHAGNGAVAIVLNADNRCPLAIHVGHAVDSLVGIHAQIKSHSNRNTLRSDHNGMVSTQPGGIKQVTDRHFLGIQVCIILVIGQGHHAGGQGETVSVERLAEIFRELENQGAHNINLVTATHFVPAVIAALDLYRPNIPIVYNCGGYESVETLRMLEGYVDVYLPDFKYIDSAMAKLLSGAPDYPEVAQAAIAEMRRQTGPAVYDEDGMMLRGTQIRHLVLPGLTGDSIRLLTRIADEWPDTPVSLMGQYTPCGRALSIKGMDRRVTKKEYARVLAHMEAIGLPGYRQALESATDAFIPAFDHTGV